MILDQIDLTKLDDRSKMLFLEAQKRGLSVLHPQLDTSENKPQRQFVSSAKGFLLGLSGNRGGKSDANAFRSVSFALWGKPAYPYQGPPLVPLGNKGWLVSLDFPASRDVMQPKIFRMIPEFRIKDWAKGDQILKLWLPDGKVSEIGFKSADSGREKFQGSDKNWIGIDEEIDYEVFRESRMRIPAGCKLFTWITLTPLLGMTWVYHKYFKPFYEDGQKSSDVEIVYPWSIYDNKKWLDADEVKRLEGELNEQEKLVRLYGRFLPLGGMPVFDTVKLFDMLDKCKPGENYEWNPYGEGLRFKKSEEGNLTIWQLPCVSYSYLITADVGEGIKGGDYSSCDVFNIETAEQVAQWHGHIDPYQLAELIADLGDWYGGAAVMPEAMGPGQSVLDRLKHIYTNICERPGLDKMSDPLRGSDRVGWKTSHPSKMRLIGCIKLAISEGWTINSKFTIHEMMTFVKKGPTLNEAQDGCNDDRVISYGIGAFMIASGNVSGLGKAFSKSELNRMVYA